VDSTCGTSCRGQWDIALRDLDFVLRLDRDDGGQVTWGEVKRQQAAIAQYAYAHLRFGDRSGKSCSIKPTRQMIDGHADGTYAALLFDVVCARAPRHHDGLRTVLRGRSIAPGNRRHSFGG